MTFAIALCYNDADIENIIEKYMYSKKEKDRFLETSTDSFAIYQLKGGEELPDYRFEGLERLQKSELSVEHDNYELVYTGLLPYLNGNQDHTLTKLYEQFNINHPADFKGHSLSISDIIAIKTNNRVSSHYVDSFGFVEQPHFLPQRNYLETAEKSVEQNHNQLDGIINNMPTVADHSEKKEKKVSVVKQLKTKPIIVKDKQKKSPQIGAEKER